MCDRRTEKTWPSSPSHLEPGSGLATGNNTAYPPRKKVVLRTRIAFKTVVLVFGLIFIFGLEGSAQDSALTEYQIKAAFLYHFAQFVEWPPQAFAGPKSPLIIGVLGENVFGDNLEQTIRNKTINNHPFQFKEFHSVEEATNCHILFICPSEKNRLPKILEAVIGTSVLTVSETDHFTEAGGMINFVIKNDEIRFQINDEAAKKAGLKISSKLLRLAVPSH